jgi:hypothetical protein
MKTTRDGLLFGVAGGFAATVVIDVVTAAVMPLMGLPATGGFSVIGDTAAGFFRMIGLKIAGGLPIGIFLHYLIGIVLGAIFGAAAIRIPAFRPASVKRGIGLGILYTEVISLPILVTPPLILGWDRSTTMQWFGFSFVMHAIWGTVLGAVVAYGLISARRQHLLAPN